MMTAAMTPRKPQTGEMLTLLERHKIQVLLDADFSAAEVSKRTGVSLDTVRRIQREAAVVHTDDKRERRERRVGRPSVAAAFTDKVAAWLKEDPDLPTQELLRRAKIAGYTGHKTAFYALVAGARPPRSAPIVRFEGLPGEFSQPTSVTSTCASSTAPKSACISSRRDSSTRASSPSHSSKTSASRRSSAASLETSRSSAVYR